MTDIREKAKEMQDWIESVDDDEEESFLFRLKDIHALTKHILDTGWVSVWQPMDTAPRDGTPVDLWHKNGFRVTEVWWTGDDCWTDLSDDSQFIGWMPLLPPPHKEGQRTNKHG